MNREEYAIRQLTRAEAAEFEESIAFVAQGRWHCWEWLGRRDSWGRGEFYVDGQWRSAHLLAWMTFVGTQSFPFRRSAPRPLPVGTWEQACLNRSCVRPGHLRWTNPEVLSVFDNGPFAQLR